MGNKKYFYYTLLLLSLFAILSCNTTKYVPKDAYLLKKYQFKIKHKNTDIENKEIKKFTQQTPNQKILGLKIPLALYSLSEPEHHKGIHKLLKNMGEEPVVWDRYQTEETRRQISNYLDKRGYYNARVSDTVKIRRQKATVKFNVRLDEPYIIDSVSYLIKDSTLRPFFLTDSVQLPVQEGSVFSVALLQQERNMIEDLFRNKGFYRFSKDFIEFVADTLNKDNQVDLKIEINPYIIKKEQETIKSAAHKRYRIDSIYIFPDYAPRLAIANKAQYFQSVDTTKYKEYFFIYNQVPGVDLDVIDQSNYLTTGQWYRQEDVNRTYERLNALRLFKTINIKFEETSDKSDSLRGGLKCFIYLQKFKLQSYTIELEGTNSSGNIGGGGNLVYSHRSFFGGAEHFQSRFTGAFEILDQEEFSRIDNTVKLGMDVRVDFPEFLVPFIRSQRFVKRYHPSTSLSGLYDYQERPDYTRTLANLSFGYHWENKKNLTHFINPIELNILQLPYLSYNFRRNLGEVYLKSSYDDHFLSVTSYSMIFNNQYTNKTSDFQYFRINTEIAGNVLAAVNNLLESHKVGDHYEIFGIRYAQFFKADLEFRHYEVLNEENRFVYRIFVGGGFPYGNSKALPFVKQYFSGGPNSLRAWNVRALGPGSYKPREGFRGYPNLTADFKFEANWEYRFDMFWILKGALFLDAGNIWSLNPEDKREGALLRMDEFYQQVAIGTGFGVRFDLSFSVFRLDLGLKLKDPSYAKGSRWLPGNRQLSGESLSWNIAIGYPF